MRRNSAKIGAPQSPSALLSLDSLSPIFFSSRFLVFQSSPAGIGTPQSPLSLLACLYFIPCSIPPFRHSSAWDKSSWIPTGASWSGLSLLCGIQHSLPTLHHFSVPLLGEHFSIPIGAPLPGSGSALPSLALIYFIPHSWPPPPFSALLR